MRESTRRQILADMGIVQWRLRTAPGTVLAAEAPAAEPVPRDEPRGPTARQPSASKSPNQAAPAAPWQPDRPETSAELASAAASAATAAAAEAAAEAGAEAPSTSQTWSVLSLCASGVVLIVAADSPRRDLRLARDVLAAASGDWAVKPLTRRFEWPPAGVGASAKVDADAVRRALVAFVEKDVDDHEAELVICAGDSAGALAGTKPGPPGRWRLLTIPELEVLGRDVEAKRRLWRELAGQRA